MRFDIPEPERDSPFRIDPRLLLIVTLAYVLTVVLTPIGWWRALAVEALALAFVIGRAGVSPREMIGRWLGFLTLFGFLTFVVAPSRPERAEFGVAVVALTLLAKDSLAFLATLLLVRVVPFHRLLVAMRRLGVPRLLVATLHFMYRYLFVFADELDRMLQARRARTFRSTLRPQWGVLGGLIGRLFLRAFERGERVHEAMLARGWDGDLRTLD